MVKSQQQVLGMDCPDCAFDDVMFLVLLFSESYGIKKEEPVYARRTGDARRR